MLVVGLAPVQTVGAGAAHRGVWDGQRPQVLRPGREPWTTPPPGGSCWAPWPSVVVGALLADQLPSGVLTVVFGLGLVVLAGFLVLVRSPEECEPGDRANAPH